jgi:chemotaxis protein CheD
MSRKQLSVSVKDTRYVDVAIDEMLQRIEAVGAKRKDMEAKLIGGANMFPSLDSDIGRDNILSAKKKLKKERIQIVGESVGGSQGKSVEFCPATGIVTVKSKF